MPVALCLVTGCASSGLNSARENFYRGNLKQASENLREIPEGNRDKILLLMERGTIHQEAGNYKESTDDWVSAWRMAEELDYLSLSQGATSLVVNERVKNFQGMPYERTMLHAFAAKSYMAMELWDDAAVEARNLIDRCQNIGKFPQDAYARYMAGFCMEMIFDSDAASRQYKEADKLTPHLTITDDGQIMRATTNAARVAKSSPKTSELVCFIGIGRSPTEFGSWSSNYRWGATPFAEIYTNGKCLGRSHNFANIQYLLAGTQKQLAAMRTLKTATRIAIKETLAATVSSENEFLGEMLRLLLYSFETPDERRWE
ncbi:hypothetical protein BVX97_03550, partial [bacterium E08(2017)]